MKNQTNNKNLITWKKGDACFWAKSDSIVKGTILEIQTSTEPSEGTASIQAKDGSVVTQPLTNLYKTVIDAGIALEINYYCNKIDSVQELIEFAYNERPSIEIEMEDYVIDVDDDDFDDEDYDECGIDIGGWRQNMEVWKSVLERKTLELLGVDLLQN